MYVVKSQDLKKEKLPDTPGVYLFVKKDPKASKGSRTRVLYVGKATSLRDRVRSYFAGDIVATRGPLIEKMLHEATSVKTQETDSVLEALVLEARLIKKYQPPYNTREKSDKSFNYVVITKEDYPRVFTVRERDISTQYDPDDFRYTFGPFPHGSQLKEALNIVRKIFPFRGEKDAVEKQQRKSHLRREIGLVPDFSVVGRRDYGRTIQHLRLFFEGRKGRLIKELEKEMRARAKKEEFEVAESIKRQIFALNHIRDVSLLKQHEPARNHSSVRANTRMRIEAYDVAHTSGVETVGVMVVLEDGRPKKADYRKFKIKDTKSKGDTNALKEILERRLKHDEWPLPKLIVVDGAKAQVNATESILADFGYQIPVVAVTKNARHQPQKILGDRKLIQNYERDIIIANSEAHRFAVSFHRKRRGRL